MPLKRIIDIELPASTTDDFAAANATIAGHLLIEAGEGGHATVQFIPRHNNNDWEVTVYAAVIPADPLNVDTPAIYVAIATFTSTDPALSIFKISSGCYYRFKQTSGDNPVTVRLTG